MDSSDYFKSSPPDPKARGASAGIPITLGEITGAVTTRAVLLEKNLEDELRLPSEPELSLGSGFILKPQMQVRVESTEVVLIPENCTALLSPRPALAITGLRIYASVMSGFQGRVPLILCNVGTGELLLKRGLNLGQLLMFKTPQQPVFFKNGEGGKDTRGGSPPPLTVQNYTRRCRFAGRPVSGRYSRDKDAQIRTLSLSLQSLRKYL